jgi:O-antigen ligase
MSSVLQRVTPGAPLALLVVPPKGPDVVTWLTLYAFILFAIPSRLVVGPLGSAGAVSMLLGLLSFGLWIILHLSRSRPSLTPVAQPIRWALGVFMFCIGISYALAMAQPLNGDEVSPADVAILSLLSWAGTMLLAHDGILTRVRLETLVWRFVQLGGLMGVLGLAQFFLRRSFVDLISIPGLTAVADAGLFYRNGLVRPSGTAIHPIEYGALLTMVLPLALHVGLSRTDRSAWLRWFPTIAIVAAIGVSSSRSAYLGAIVGVVVCAIAWSKQVRVRLFSIAAIGLVAASVVLPRLINSIVGLFAGAEEDPSITSRTDSFSFAWAFILESPLFGRGLGTFLPKYRIFDNQYLGMLVSIGVIGTIALVGIAVAVVAVMVRVYRTADSPATADLAVSLTASVLAGFVSLAFFDAFAFPMTMGTLFLVMGMAGALGRLTQERPPTYW